MNAYVQPGDLLRITTSDGDVLEVIRVNGRPSPYVRFDWDWPRWFEDDEEEGS